LESLRASAAQTSLGGANHQAAAAALKAAGLDIRKMRVVIFPSGGAATTAMLGGHVDVVPITAAFASSMAKQGQVRVVAVASPTRMPGVLADVPTWREQGFDAVVTNWRVMVGPKGMSEAQTAYWEEALRRLSDSDEWKKELEANAWMSEFMRSAETRKFLERENTEVRSFLVDLGLAK
jgi:putative tricarboxylic transport membrane protein